MNSSEGPETGRRLGRRASAAIVAAAVVLGLVVLHHVNRYPRTDDAEIFANFIGIAPQAEGPIVRLNVIDNQFVKKGELLFEIDSRPYEYALQKAISDQGALEGRIADERRTIAAQVSAVSVSKASILSAQADVTRWAAAIEQARADVAGARQGVSRAKAEWAYASNNLHRIEPLLAKKFVTVDQVEYAPGSRRPARACRISECRPLSLSTSSTCRGSPCKRRFWWQGTVLSAFYWDCS